MFVTLQTINGMWDGEYTQPGKKRLPSQQSVTEFGQARPCVMLHCTNSPFIHTFCVLTRRPAPGLCQP